MSSFDEEVINSLMQNGDSQEVAEEKLKATKEVLKKADALMETETIRGVLSRSGNTSVVPILIQQIADKLNESNSKKRQFDDIGYESEGEYWGYLPDANASIKISKKMFGNGRKTRRSTHKRRGTKKHGTKKHGTKRRN
jgi:hypothetical protein